MHVDKMWINLWIKNAKKIGLKKKTPKNLKIEVKKIALKVKKIAFSVKKIALSLGTRIK